MEAHLGEQLGAAEESIERELEVKWWGKRGLRRIAQMVIVGGPEEGPV